MSNDSHLDGHSGESPFSINHSQFIRRCLELARIPGAAVEPNPRVGAVVVHQGRIIGEGCHERYGGPHAEVNAVRSVANKELLRDCTLYVSLEPCNHHGKTPPCTDLILEHGIPRVFVCSLDPNPQMRGKSVAMLHRRGVAVTLLDDYEDFIELNKHFWVNQQLHRPYILLKWAESADGFIAGLNAEGRPEPRAISGMETNRYFHSLRHELQGILIGRETALVDNPSLTTRHFPGRNPLRLVLDESGDLPPTLKVFEGEGAMVIRRGESGQEGNIRYFGVPDPFDLPDLLRRLYAEARIGSILVEGGANVLQQFIDAGEWDEIIRCVAPLRLGAGVAAPMLLEGMEAAQVIASGEDRLEVFRKPT
ncbi:MAG: bifunctional diaminohydroxyphosphoribosylaminopyrimidine deaminase/5-amino-6-(5-phosphoribosylamino)uracil reductase RibD [Bacteroidia bacterium]